ncbi:MAG TPA: hypothetical protein PKI71_16685, partial [Candidatus Rifleibacterium sp.]|nr:hypothetical protein [Candidatus Rifleibacterium sp.]
KKKTHCGLTIQNRHGKILTFKNILSCLKAQLKNLKTHPVTPMVKSRFFSVTIGVKDCLWFSKKISAAWITASQSRGDWLPTGSMEKSYSITTTLFLLTPFKRPDRARQHCYRPLFSQPDRGPVRQSFKIHQNPVLSRPMSGQPPGQIAHILCLAVLSCTRIWDRRDFQAFPAKATALPVFSGNADNPGPDMAFPAIHHNECKNMRQIRSCKSCSFDISCTNLHR